MQQLNLKVKGITREKPSMTIMPIASNGTEVRIRYPR